MLFFKKKETPCCKICVYNKIDPFNIPENVNVFYNVNAARYSCEAQGFKETMNCYNTPECQKLFRRPDLIETAIKELYEGKNA